MPESHFNNHNMPGNLFSEFDLSNNDVWKKQAEQEMKQPVSEIRSLRRDGLNYIPPFQSARDLDEIRLDDLRNAQKRIPGWANVQVVQIDEPWAANSKIDKALKNGADGIYLKTKAKSIAKCEFSKVLHNVRLSENAVFFESGENAAELFDVISKGAGYYIKGGIAHDPVANWMRSGKDFEPALKAVVSLFEKTKNMREFYPVMIEGHIFHNSGANPVQELAFMAGTLVFYLDKLTEAGIAPVRALNHCFFSVSIGTAHLTEIAKLRALRFIYRKISSAYEVPDELCSAYIHTCTSSFYSTEQTPHNNLLRAASEAMSAVTGGCDALTVLGYNDGFVKYDDFSDRIARNLSLLISSESYLSHVADPAAGSYFIENLSLQLADAAWDLFLETEQKGGIIECFKTGFIQDEIEKSWLDKLTSMDQDKIMVGVNKYVSDQPVAHPDSTGLDISDSNGLRILSEKNLAGAWNHKSMT